MPDIQTEMQKILQAWEQPYPLTETTPQPETTQPPKDTPMFTKTIGVSEASFNIVRDQPGLPKKEYIRMLEKAGFKSASTSSILSQMMKQGHVWADSSGCWHPNQTAYTPLKPSKKPKTAKSYKVITSKKHKPKDVPVPEGIAALVEEHKARDEVQHIMNTLSLPDAKRLYNALATYFATP